MPISETWMMLGLVLTIAAFAFGVHLLDEQNFRRALRLVRAHSNRHLSSH